MFSAVCKRCRLLLSKDKISDDCASPLSVPEVVIQEDQSRSVHAPTSEPVCIIRFEKYDDHTCVSPCNQGGLFSVNKGKTSSNIPYARPYYKILKLIS